MRLVGPPELLALHGCTLPRGARPVIALGDEPADAPEVWWRATPGDAAPGVRMIAPAGAGLWRRAPLPAADALFALPPAGPDAPLLVVGGEEEARAAAVRALEQIGAAALDAAAPSPDALAAARVVVLVGTPGEPLDSLAPAVLAAGRVLVAPSATPAFGFGAGVDHLAYKDPEELARLALAAHRHPEAFAPLAVLGRLAAEAHRASTVLARVAADLTSGPAPAPRRPPRARPP